MLIHVLVTSHSLAKYKFIFGIFVWQLVKLLKICMKDQTILFGGIVKMHFKGLRSRRLASNAIIGFYSKLLGSVSYLSEKLEKLSLISLITLLKVKT